MSWSWSSWKLDVFTWAWIIWVLWFAAWETVALMQRGNQELTEHLRPLFLSQPLTLFLAFGLWLWIGVHLLVPSLEAWIIKAASGRL
jgi:hypothetical protein